MFFTLFSVALVVAALRGVSAGFAINSPQLVQCQTAKISWAPATPPYNLIVAPASNMCGDPLVDLGDFNQTSTQWVAALPAGTQVYLSVLDNGDNEAWSDLITVGPSSDASCLSSSGTSSGSSTESSASPSPTPSSGLNPLGAANAGLLHSSASSVRQASSTLLILAGLAVVVALIQ